MKTIKCLIFITASLMLLACQTSQTSGSYNEKATDGQYVMILDRIRTEDPSAILAFRWDGNTWFELSGSDHSSSPVLEGKKWISRATAEAPVGIKYEGCNFKNTTWFKSPLYCLTSIENIAEGESSSQFSGWSSKPVPRPIVFVQNKKGVKFSALEAIQENKDSRKIVEDQFISQNKFVYNCSSIDKPSTEKSRTKISHQNIKLISQFSLGKEGEILTIQLDPSLLKCDGPVEDPWLSKTYFVSPDRKIKFLGNSLVPLEFGDLVGDGKVEMIFFFSGYNEDGYVLYYDFFSKSEKFSWHYH